MECQEYRALKVLKVTLAFQEIKEAWAYLDYLVLMEKREKKEKKEIMDWLVHKALLLLDLQAPLAHKARQVQWDHMAFQDLRVPLA